MGGEEQAGPFLEATTGFILIVPGSSGWVRAAERAPVHPGKELQGQPGREGLTVLLTSPILTGLAVSEHLQEQRAGICQLLSPISPANAWGGP